MRVSALYSVLLANSRQSPCIILVNKESPSTGLFHTPRQNGECTMLNEDLYQNVVPPIFLIIVSIASYLV